MELGENGVEDSVVFTSDDQVTVIVPAGSIDAAPGQHSVVMTINPLDPATVPSVVNNGEIFGNAYAMAATYEPSGAAVTRVDDRLNVSLYYPATATLPLGSHEMLFSPNGEGAWSVLDSTDLKAMQEVGADVPGFGTVLVVGEDRASEPSSSTGSTTLSISLLVAAGGLLLVGIGLLLRSRRS